MVKILSPTGELQLHSFLTARGFFALQLKIPGGSKPPPYGAVIGRAAHFSMRIVRRFLVFSSICSVFVL
jgi:hypothetical protein